MMMMPLQTNGKRTDDGEDDADDDDDDTDGRDDDDDDDDDTFSMKHRWPDTITLVKAPSLWQQASASCS